MMANELSAQDAVSIVRSYPDSDRQETEIAGIITDQDEAMRFLKWLCSPEAKAIGEKLRSHKTQQ